MTVDVTAELSKHRIAVKAELTKKGLKFPGRPRYPLPKLPVNLTDIAYEEVMVLLVKFTRYQDHLAGELALYEIDESTAATMVEVAKAKHLVHAWTGASGDRVTVAKAEAVIDSSVREYEEAMIMAKSHRKGYSVLVESLARDAAVVSREITRRGGGAPVERRANRYTP
jgi:hypothetical protein